MGDDHFQMLRALFRPWYVKVGSAFATICAGIGVYAGIQDQFPALPKLQEMVAVAHFLLLPWWGWLLVLQAVLMVGLYEYVRRMLPPNPQPKPRLPSEIETRFDGVRVSLEAIWKAINEIKADRRLDEQRPNIASITSQLRSDFVERAAKTNNEMVELKYAIGPGARAGYLLARREFLVAQQDAFVTLQQRAETSWSRAISTITNPTKPRGLSPEGDWLNALRGADDIANSCFAERIDQAAPPSPSALALASPEFNKVVRDSDRAAYLQWYDIHQNTELAMRIIANKFNDEILSLTRDIEAIAKKRN